MFVQTSIPEWFSSRNVSAWTDKEYTYTVCPRDKKILLNFEHGMKFM